MRDGLSCGGLLHYRVCNLQLYNAAFTSNEIHRPQHGYHSISPTKGLWIMPLEGLHATAEQLKVAVRAAALYLSRSEADGSFYLKCQ